MAQKGSSSVEKKYCECVVKVSKNSPRYNPYAICTKSVYGSRGIKRDKIIQCSQKVNFSDFTLAELKGYAKMKKLKYQGLKKSQLINLLEQYAEKGRKKSKNGKSPWFDFLSKYRSKNPDMPYRQALKKASQLYRKQ